VFESRSPTIQRRMRPKNGVPGMCPRNQGTDYPPLTAKHFTDLVVDRRFGFQVPRLWSLPAQVKIPAFANDLVGIADRAIQVDYFRLARNMSANHFRQGISRMNYGFGLTAFARTRRLSCVT
jgi:hypothetical protein